MIQSYKDLVFIYMVNFYTNIISTFQALMHCKISFIWTRHKIEFK